MDVEVEAKPSIKEQVIDLLLFGKVPRTISFSLTNAITAGLSVLKFFIDYDNIWVQILLSVSIVLTAFLSGMIGVNMFRAWYFHSFISGLDRTYAGHIYEAFQSGGSSRVHDDNVRSIVNISKQHPNIMDNELPNGEVRYGLSDIKYRLKPEFLKYLTDSKWAQAKLAERARVSA